MSGVPTSAEWAVWYGIPARIRPCRSEQHARRVLAGWPDHLGPAHVVRRTRGGDWQPPLTRRTTRRTGGAR